MSQTGDVLLLSTGRLLAFGDERVISVPSKTLTPGGGDGERGDGVIIETRMTG